MPGIDTVERQSFIEVSEATQENIRHYEDESDLIKMFNNLQNENKLDGLPENVIAMTEFDFATQSDFLDTPRRETAVVDELVKMGYQKLESPLFVIKVSNIDGLPDIVEECCYYQLKGIALYDELKICTGLLRVSPDCAKLYLQMTTPITQFRESFFGDVILDMHGIEQSRFLSNDSIDAAEVRFCELALRETHAEKGEIQMKLVSVN